MPLSVNDIVEACTLVAEQEQIKICLSESLKGAGIAGLGAFAMGVMMGPVGLALGGALGGLAASKYCKKYEPLWQIMGNMKEQDKERLYYHMMKTIEKLDVTDAVVLLTLVTNKGAGYKAIVEGVLLFAQQMSS